MIAPSQIVRSIESREYRLLVNRLLSNGRCHSRVAREVFRHADSLQIAALGLGLQRIGELAYWALPEGHGLASHLLRLQRQDGFFGSTHADIDLLIAPTAIAVRALIDWLTHFEHDEAERSLLQQSVDRACHALDAAFEREAHEMHDNDAIWAVVLWQLGDCEIACDHLPMREIRDRIKAAAPEFRADDLSRLALTMAA